MDHRTEVSELLHDRLEELGITPSELARRSGIALRTIQSTVAGETKIGEDKRAAIERVLQLRPGSLRRAYKTGQPFETTDGETVEEVAEEISVSRRDFEQLLELAERLRQQYPLPERPAEHRDDRPA